MTEEEVLAAYRRPLSAPQGDLPQTPGGSVEPVELGCCLPDHRAVPFFGRSPLGDCLPDYAVFTAAVPMAVGGLAIDPVADWACRHDAADRICYVRFGRPLFRSHVEAGGLWSTLWLCPRELWDPLKIYLANLVAVDIRRGQYWRSFAHKVKLPDPVDGRDCRVLLADAFGVTGSDGVYWIESGEAPYVRRADPEPAIAQQASVYLGAAGGLGGD